MSKRFVGKTRLKKLLMVASLVTCMVFSSITAFAGSGKGDVTKNPDSEGSGSLLGDIFRDKERAMFDDFDYENSSDPKLVKFNWTVRDWEGGPGVPGAKWSKDNISFVGDQEKRGNKFMRLTSSTDGTNGGTSQAEMFHQQKFYEGTYAARVRFSDAPVSGPDGDNIVQTFFSITPLKFDMDPDYCEYDFEYLPNGGWGEPSNIMYETSWETYQNEPWVAINQHGSQSQSFGGWHTLVCVIKDGRINYYIDGKLMAEHGDKYYPEVPMTINFNQWFISGGLVNSSERRSYTEDVDWVYYVQDTALTTEQVQKVVDNYRKKSVKRIDSIIADIGPVPQAASLKVDTLFNGGNYIVTATVPENDTATSLRLYENDKLILNKNLKPDQKKDRQIEFKVTNKAIGVYEYRVESSNCNGTKQGQSVKVTVLLSMFDDFQYTSSRDPRLSAFNWTVRDWEGGPGVPGAKWSKDNISFVSDLEKRGNKFMRLTSSTDGTNGGTSQAEMIHQQKFYEGTYAARVRFSDAPVSGPDGDNIVQTFFSITPLKFDMDPDYCEYDFEYLPNGGWGEPSSIMYQTSWETYQNEPWVAVNQHGSQSQSFDGWHTLVCVIKDGRINYYIDGKLMAEHGDKYYPEVPMTINFNQWFISGGLVNSSERRSYTEDVDWVYFAQDTALTTEQVQNIVNGYRDRSVEREDLVKSNIGAVPEAALLSVDNASNFGDYTVTVTVPAANTASSIRLYENDKLVLYKETAVGSPNPQTFTYPVRNQPVRDYTYRVESSNSNGSKASIELVVKVSPPDGSPVNVALGKSVTASVPMMGNTAFITDGVKNTDNFVGVTENLQWVQMDLGASFDINKVNLWHYFGDGRTYKDVIVRLSNTSDFSSGVTTVFNNDTDNSAGFGTGSDTEYAESAAGKSISFNTVNARYIRLYTNGSSANIYNHYVEVEVWTAGV